MIVIALLAVVAIGLWVQYSIVKSLKSASELPAGVTTGPTSATPTTTTTTTSTTAPAAPTEVKKVKIAPAHKK